MKWEPIFHPPSVEELAARVARVQDKMSEHNLDWYVCFQPDNAYYLSHFYNYVHERPFLLLIPAKGQMTYVAPKLEITHIEYRAIGSIDLVDYAEYPAPAGAGWSDRLTDVLGDARRVGVESAMTLEIFDAIQAERARIDIIDDLRMVKSDYEIGRMVYSANIGNAALNDLLASAEVGRSMGASRNAAEQLMIGRLAQDNPLFNSVITRAIAVFQTPDVSHDPHNFKDLEMRMVEGGPHVSIVNAVLDGYGTEVERTFFLGHVPEAAKKPYEVMMRAREIAFSMVKPGEVMSEVDHAVHRLYEAEGHTYLPHRTGHGMGVTGHEAPFLAKGYPRIIEPGMSFTIEPGVYLPGIGGFRHSDTIIVTETGNRCLTDAVPDSLEAMTLPI
jgi:Xaa-Pro dipeptidase